ncbi:hypothetical protein CQA44_09950 [Helicobacter sp. MIT 14-3879]|nr:hypothetical protein CQA44_09950 [Helicobacter sp. MIT 14-3879]
MALVQEPVLQNDKGLDDISSIQKGDSIISQIKNRHDSVLETLHLEHKKAAHFVTASRVMGPNKQILESSSDDGEPKGSAGMPILEVLRGEQIINAMCVCVRYFGGIKLGIGGLVRAYTQASLNVIAKAKESHLLEPYTVKETFTLTQTINHYNLIAYLAHTHGLEILQKKFLGETFNIVIQGESKNIQSFLKELQHLSLNYKH